MTANHRGWTSVIVILHTVMALHRRPNQAAAGQRLAGDRLLALSFNMIPELLSLCACVCLCVFPSTHILALHVSHNPFTQTFPTSLLLPSSLSLSLSFSSLVAIISRQTVNQHLPLSSVGACLYTIPCRSLRHLQLHVFYFIFFFSSIIPLTQITLLIIAFFFFSASAGLTVLGLFYYFVLACWASSHRPPHSTLYTLHSALCPLPFQEPSHCVFCRPEVIRFISCSYQRVYPDSFDQTIRSGLFLAHSTYIDQAVFRIVVWFYTNIDKYIYPISDSVILD